MFAPTAQPNQNPLSRRTLLLSLSVAALGAGIGLKPTPTLAQKKTSPAEVPMEELMRPGALPELAIGPADAKVVVVEFASMTCGHCASFHKNVWPEFQKKYIDTNKVRFIFREFPLDNLAAAASMLARCAGGDKSFPLIRALFEKQEDWAFAKGNPVPKLFELAKQAGFTQESFDKCLTDQKLLDNITNARKRASEVYGISSTPTFFINGKRLAGTPSIAAFDKMIEPLLAKS